MRPALSSGAGFPRSSRVLSRVRRRRSPRRRTVRPSQRIAAPPGSELRRRRPRAWAPFDAVWSSWGTTLGFDGGDGRRGLLDAIVVGRLCRAHAGAAKEASREGGDGPRLRCFTQLPRPETRRPSSPGFDAEIRALCGGGPFPRPWRSRPWGGRRPLRAADLVELPHAPAGACRAAQAFHGTVSASRWSLCRSRLSRGAPRGHRTTPSSPPRRRHVPLQRRRLASPTSRRTRRQTTRQVNARAAGALPLGDTKDFENARRGLIAKRGAVTSERRTGGSSGLSARTRSRTPMPSRRPVHPSLWRRARLNAIHGLPGRRPGLPAPRVRHLEHGHHRGEYGAHRRRPARQHRDGEGGARLLFRTQAEEARRRRHLQSQSRRPLRRRSRGRGLLRHGRRRESEEGEDLRARMDFSSTPRARTVCAGNAMELRRSQVHDGIALPKNPHRSRSTLWPHGKAPSTGTISSSCRRPTRSGTKPTRSGSSMGSTI